MTSLYNAHGEWFFLPHSLWRRIINLLLLKDTRQISVRKILKSLNFLLMRQPIGFFAGIFGLDIPSDAEKQQQYGSSGDPCNNIFFRDCDISQSNIDAVIKQKADRHSIGARNSPRLRRVDTLQTAKTN